MADDARRAAVLKAVDSALAPPAAAARLCQVCVSLLTVDTVGVSLRPRAGHADAVFGSSAERAGTVSELQFTLGEGPSVDAVAHNRAVLAADLEHDGARWPVFTPAVLAEGVAAIFAFPVRLGDNTAVGSLDLLRSRPGHLSAEDLDLADYAAQVVSAPLRAWMHDVQAAENNEDGKNQGPLDDLELQRVEVYQATGMLMGQMDITAEDALLRLRAYAYRRGAGVSEVAGWVISRRLRFTPDGDPVDAEESAS